MIDLYYWPTPNGHKVTMFLEEAHVLLRREGCTHGRNTTDRLHLEERLQLRSKLPRRRKRVVTRSLRVKPTEADQAWTMDFVADQLSSGARSVHSRSSMSSAARR